VVFRSELLRGKGLATYRARLRYGREGRTLKLSICNRSGDGVLCGKLHSPGISGIDAALPSPIGAECTSSIPSAFGKAIL
jgi:hypothetical protein